MTTSDILLRATNAARHSAGIKPVHNHPLLQRAAQAHAAAMALGGYFDHVDNAGRGVGERLLAEGYNYRWSGENISAGKDQPQAVIDWWLSSRSHRDNMLKAEFTDVGFGYYFIAQDKNQFHHYWVQVFASPLISDV